MGSGSSRARKARSGGAGGSPARRRLGAPRWGSGRKSAPGGHEQQAEAAEAAAPGSQEDLPGADAAAAAESEAELLDLVLAECCDDDVQLLPSAFAFFPHPAGGSGSGDGPDGAAAQQQQQVSLTGSTADLESNNLANELSLKMPERKNKITYDYSEEELMATIELEYCR